MSRSSTLLLLACTMGGIAALAGCGQRDADPVPAVAGSSAAAGSVATAGMLDGQGFIEFTAGRKDGWRDGDIARVTDGDRVVAMARLTALIGEDRASARIISLADKTREPRPGDRVVPMADLAAPDPADRTLRSGPVAPNDNLRIGYQREMDQLAARHREALEAQRAAHGRALAEAAQAAEARIALIEQRHRAEILGKDEAALAAKADADRSAGERVRVETAAVIEERDRLRTQIDGLLAATRALNERIAAMAAEAESRDRLRTRAVLVEAETRDALARKVAELEARIQGRASAVAAALTRDGSRSEGVLERLDRLQGEAEIANDRAIRAERQLAAAQAALAKAQEQRTRDDALITDAEQVRISAGRTDQRIAALTREADAARTALAKAGEERAGAELARLESERALFDLAARILRAGDDPEALRQLQARMRALVADRLDAAPAAVQP